MTHNAACRYNIICKCEILTCHRVKYCNSYTLFRRLAFTAYFSCVRISVRRTELTERPANIAHVRTHVLLADSLNLAYCRYVCGTGKKESVLSQRKVESIGMALPFYKIAKNLSIATSTAHRLFQKFASSGDVWAVQRSCRPELRALDEHSELIIIGLILESPTLYLDEVVQEVKEITSLTVSPPTICRLFKRYGFTRKRVRQIASQRCYPLRGAYMAHCTLFRRDMFVWIDETGSDARDHIRRFGYALRGMTPTSRRLLVRGKSSTDIEWTSHCRSSDRNS